MSTHDKSTTWWSNMTSSINLDKQSQSKFPKELTRHKNIWALEFGSFSENPNREKIDPWTKNLIFILNTLCDSWLNYPCESRLIDGLREDFIAVEDNKQIWYIIIKVEEKCR